MRVAREIDLRRLVVLADNVRAAQRDYLENCEDEDGSLVGALVEAEKEYDEHRKRFHL